MTSAAAVTPAVINSQSLLYIVDNDQIQSRSTTAGKNLDF